MPFFPGDTGPILFALIIFAFLAIVVVAIIAAGVLKRKKEIEAYKAAIEKGLAPDDVKMANSTVGTLRSGLVWIATGIGLFIVILAAGGTRSLAVSAIPILIGFALVVSYAVEKK